MSGAVVNLAELDGTNGFRLDGAEAFSLSGSSVSSAGDVNSDGFDDLIIGAPLVGPSAGSSYVVFGGPSTTPTLAGDFALDVARSGRVALTLDDLTASDVQSGPDALVFTVTTTSRGFIALDAAPDTPATHFTQADLAAGRVAFVHGGTAKPTAGFTVTVRDGDNETVGPQTVAVAVALELGTFRVEAENFTLGAGFAVKALRAASGGANIEALGFKGDAVATYRFDGLAGLYDLRLGYFDENDGVARMRLLVNGAEIDAWDWDSPFGADRPTAQSLTERLFADVALETGDVIELRGTRAPGEPLRTDYIDFVAFRDPPDEPPPSPPSLSGDFALEVDNGGSIALTLDDFSASDAESGPDALTFTVSSATAGFVARAAAPATAIASFTQAEIDAGAILFVHDGSAGPAAGFTVTVTDGDGNVAGPRTVAANVTPVNAPPAFVSAVEVDPAAGEVAAFLLTAADPDGDALAFSAAVTDDLSGEPVDAAAWTLTDNGDGTARFAWSDRAARDGVYTALLSVGDGKASDTTAILFEGSAVFDDPAPRLIVRAGGTGGPTLAPQFEVYVDGVLVGVETIDDPFSGSGPFHRGDEARYRDYAFVVPEALAGDDVVIRYVNDATDPVSGKRLALFVHSVTIDGLTLGNDPFGFYLSDRPGAEASRSGFGKPMRWDGVTVFADVEAQAARGVVEVIAAGVGAPGEGPAFSVFADGRRLGRVETPDPVDAAGRPAAEAFDSFRFALPRGLDPREVRIVYDEAPAAGGVDPALWIDAIVVDGVRREAEEDGFFVPRNFADGGFGPRELLSASGTLAFADLHIA